MIFTNRFLCCFCSAAILLFFSLKVHAQEYGEKRREVNAKIRALKALIASSQQVNIDTRRAQATVHVATQFLQFSSWDFSNHAALTQVFRQWEPVSNDAKNQAEQLAIQELKDCISILDDARAHLLERQSNINDPNATFRIDMDAIEPNGGHYYVGARPVFLHGILWAPNDLPYSFGQFSLAYMHPDYLNEQGDPINSGQREWFKSGLDQTRNHQRAAYLFLGHVAPKWARNESNTTGKTTFVDYNIDHPDVKTWWRNLLDGLGPTYFTHPAALNNTMMANEPHWFSTENPWGYAEVSNETQTAFRIWLVQRHGTVNTLNERWDADYQDFDEVSVQTPLSRNLQGSGRWYDWCQFNMHRSMTFFHLLNSEIERQQPGSLNHIKVPSQLFLDRGHDHGIDWRRIADEFGMLGIDSTVTHHAGIHRFRPSARQSRYSIDWTPSIAALDLLKTVAPDKILFDSEWHAISNIHWRDPMMTEDYVRSTLWLHHLSGMGMNQCWYWGRKADGSPIANNQDEFFGSLTTQPKALNSYLRTMIELNDHAEQIVAHCNSPRKIGLLYCEDSAIQRSDYLANFSEVYQALKFTGLKVAIVPARQVGKRGQGNGNSSLSELEALFIPPTKVIDAKLLARINRRFSDIDICAVGGNSFTSDPYGKIIEENDRAILLNATQFDFAPAQQLHDRFNSHLRNLIESQAVLVNRDGLPPWGLLQFRSEGMMVLTNVIQSPLELEHGEETVILQPMQTRVIVD